MKKVSSDTVPKSQQKHSQTISDLLNTTADILHFASPELQLSDRLSLRKKLSVSLRYGELQGWEQVLG